MSKVNIIVNGKRMDFKDNDPIVQLLVLAPEDYKHSIAPNKVILEFDGYNVVYEIPTCLSSTHE